MMMKQLRAGLFGMALLSLIASLSPAQAQTAAATTKSTGPLSYDATKEITLNATVESVVTKPTHGMLWGSHLMLQTSSGKFDASLGRVPLTGKDAISIEAGQRVKVTGVLKTLKSGEVMLTRTVEVNGHVYTLRNAHGMPEVRTRRNASPKTGTEGGQA
jgi:hypothetical protein